jgi:hypothetical protein
MRGRPRMYNTLAEQHQIRHAQKQKWKRTRAEQQREVINSDETPEADVLADAERIKHLWHETIVGNLMGDPLSGRSALDKSRSGT